MRSAVLNEGYPGLCTDFGAGRLHIPIKSSSQVDFRVNGTPVTMAPGECWYLRLSDPHSVSNRGSSDRIHLVIDAKVDAWLAGQLSIAAVAEGE